MISQSDGNITFVSNFSWLLQFSQEKSKTMCVQTFGRGGEGGEGVNKVHYGICENDESGALFHALQG